MTIDEMMEQQPLGDLLRLYAAYELWQDDPSVSLEIIKICDERTDELSQQILPLLAPIFKGVPKSQHRSAFHALINKIANGAERKWLKALVSFDPH